MDGVDGVDGVNGVDGVDGGSGGVGGEGIDGVYGLGAGHFFMLQVLTSSSGALPDRAALGGRT